MRTAVACVAVGAVQVAWSAGFTSPIVFFVGLFTFVIGVNSLYKRLERWLEEV